MKVILTNQRLGHTRTFVIRGWLKGLLSLCLLGAPVALGYLGYQLSVQSGEPFLSATESGSPHTLVSGSQVLLSDGRRAPDAQAPGRTHALAAPRGTAADPVLPVSVRSAALAPRRQSASLPLEGSALRAPVTFRHGRVIDPAAYRFRSPS